MTENNIHRVVFEQSLGGLEDMKKVLASILGPIFGPIVEEHFKNAPIKGADGVSIDSGTFTKEVTSKILKDIPIKKASSGPATHPALQSKIGLSLDTLGLTTILTRALSKVTLGNEQAGASSSNLDALRPVAASLTHALNSPNVVGLLSAVHKVEEIRKLGTQVTAPGMTKKERESSLSNAIEIKQESRKQIKQVFDGVTKGNKKLKVAFENERAYADDLYEQITNSLVATSEKTDTIVGSKQPRKIKKTSSSSKVKLPKTQSPASVQRDVTQIKTEAEQEKIISSPPPKKPTKKVVLASTIKDTVKELQRNIYKDTPPYEYVKTVIQGGANPIRIDREAPRLAAGVVNEVGAYVENLKSSLDTLKDNVVERLDTEFDKVREKGKGNWQIARKPGTAGRDVFQLEAGTGKWRADAINMSRMRKVIPSVGNIKDLSTVIEQARNVLIDKDSRNQDDMAKAEAIGQWLRSASEADIDTAAIATPIKKNLLEVRDKYNKSKIYPAEALQAIRGATGNSPKELDTVYRRTWGKKMADARLTDSGIIKPIIIPAAETDTSGNAYFPTSTGSKRHLNRFVKYVPGISKIVDTAIQANIPGAVSLKEKARFAESITPEGTALHDINKQLEVVLPKMDPSRVKEMYRDAVVSRAAEFKRTDPNFNIKAFIEKNNKVIETLTKVGESQKPKNLLPLVRNMMARGITPYHVAESQDTVEFSNIFDVQNALLEKGGFYEKAAKNPYSSGSEAMFSEQFATSMGLLPVSSDSKAGRGHFAEDRMVIGVDLGASFPTNEKGRYSVFGDPTKQQALRIAIDKRLRDMTYEREVLDREGGIAYKKRLPNYIKHAAATGLTEEKSSWMVETKTGVVSGGDDDDQELKGASVLDVLGDSIMAGFAGGGPQSRFGAAITQGGRVTTSVNNGLRSAPTSGIATSFPLLVTPQERALQLANRKGSSGTGYNPLVRLEKTPWGFEDSIIIGGRLKDSLLEVAKTVLKPTSKGDAYSLKSEKELAMLSGVGGVAPGVLKGAFTDESMEDLYGRFQTIFGMDEMYRTDADNAFIKNVKQATVHSRGKDPVVDMVEVVEQFGSHWGDKFISRGGNKGVAISTQNYKETPITEFLSKAIKAVGSKKVRLASSNAASQGGLGFKVSELTSGEQVADIIESLSEKELAKRTGKEGFTKKDWQKVFTDSGNAFMLSAAKDIGDTGLLSEEDALYFREVYDDYLKITKQKHEPDEFKAISKLKNLHSKITAKTGKITPTGHADVDTVNIASAPTAGGLEVAGPSYKAEAVDMVQNIEGAARRGLQDEVWEAIVGNMLGLGVTSGRQIAVKPTVDKTSDYWMGYETKKGKNVAGYIAKISELYGMKSGVSDKPLEDRINDPELINSLKAKYLAGKDSPTKEEDANAEKLAKEVLRANYESPIITETGKLATSLVAIKHMVPINPAGQYPSWTAGQIRSGEKGLKLNKPTYESFVEYFGKNSAFMNEINQSKKVDNEAMQKLTAYLVHSNNVAPELKKPLFENLPYVPLGDAKAFAQTQGTFNIPDNPAGDLTNTWLDTSRFPDAFKTNMIVGGSLASPDISEYYVPGGDVRKTYPNEQLAGYHVPNKQGRLYQKLHDAAQEVEDLTAKYNHVVKRVSEDPNDQQAQWDLVAFKGGEGKLDKGMHTRGATVALSEKVNEAIATKDISTQQLMAKRMLGFFKATGFAVDKTLVEGLKKADVSSLRKGVDAIVGPSMERLALDDMQAYLGSKPNMTQEEYSKDDVIQEFLQGDAGVNLLKTTQTHKKITDRNSMSNAISARSTFLSSNTYKGTKDQRSSDKPYDYLSTNIKPLDEQKDKQMLQSKLGFLIGSFGLAGGMGVNPESQFKTGVAKVRKYMGSIIGETVENLSGKNKGIDTLISKHIIPAQRGTVVSVPMDISSELGAFQKHIESIGTTLEDIGVTPSTNLKELAKNVSNINKGHIEYNKELTDLGMPVLPMGSQAAHPAKLRTMPVTFRKKYMVSSKTGRVVEDSQAQEIDSNLLDMITYKARLQKKLGKNINKDIRAEVAAFIGDELGTTVGTYRDPNTGTSSVGTAEIKSLVVKNKQGKAINKEVVVIPTLPRLDMPALEETRKTFSSFIDDLVQQREKAMKAGDTKKGDALTKAINSSTDALAVALPKYKEFGQKTDFDGDTMAIFAARAKEARQEMGALYKQQQGHSASTNIESAYRSYKDYEVVRDSAMSLGDTWSDASVAFYKKFPKETGTSFGKTPFSSEDMGHLTPEASLRLAANGGSLVSKLEEYAASGNITGRNVKKLGSFIKSLKESGKEDDSSFIMGALQKNFTGTSEKPGLFDEVLRTSKREVAARIDQENVTKNQFKMHTGQETEKMLRIKRLYGFKPSNTEGILGASGHTDITRMFQINELLRIALQAGMDTKKGGAPMGTAITEGITKGVEGIPDFMEKIANSKDQKAFGEVLDLASATDTAVRKRVGAFHKETLWNEVKSRAKKSDIIPTQDDYEGQVDFLVKKEGFTGFLEEAASHFENLATAVYTDYAKKNKIENPEKYAKKRIAKEKKKGGIALSSIQDILMPERGLTSWGADPTGLIERYERSVPTEYRAPIPAWITDLDEHARPKAIENFKAGEAANHFLPKLFDDMFNLKDQPTIYRSQINAAMQQVVNRKKEISEIAQRASARKIELKNPEVTTTDIIDGSAFSGEDLLKNAFSSKTRGDYSFVLGENIPDVGVYSPSTRRNRETTKKLKDIASSLSDKVGILPRKKEESATMVQSVKGLLTQRGMDAGFTFSESDTPERQAEVSKLLDNYVKEMTTRVLAMDTIARGFGAAKSRNAEGVVVNEMLNPSGRLPMSKVTSEGLSDLLLYADTDEGHASKLQEAMHYGAGTTLLPSDVGFGAQASFGGDVIPPSGNGPLFGGAGPIPVYIVGAANGVGFNVTPGENQTAGNHALENIRGKLSTFIGGNPEDRLSSKIADYEVPYGGIPAGNSAKVSDEYLPVKSSEDFSKAKNLRKLFKYSRGLINSYKDSEGREISTTPDKDTPTELAEIIEQARQGGPPSLRTDFVAKFDELNKAGRIKGGSFSDIYRQFGVAYQEGFANKTESLEKEMQKLDPKSDAWSNAYRLHSDITSQWGKYVEDTGAKPTSIISPHLFNREAQQVQQGYLSAAGLEVKPMESKDILDEIFKGNTDKFSLLTEIIGNKNKFTNTYDTILDRHPGATARYIQKSLGAHDPDQQNFDMVNRDLLQMHLALQIVTKDLKRSGNTEEALRVQTIASMLGDVPKSYNKGMTQEERVKSGFIPGRIRPSGMSLDEQMFYNKTKIDSIPEYMKREDIKRGQRVSFSTHVTDDQGNVYEKKRHTFTKKDETGHYTSHEEDLLQPRNTLMGAFGRALRWGIAARVIYGGAAAVTQGVQDTAQTEYQMAELKKIMDSPKTDFGAMQKGAFDIGKQYGVNPLEVMKSMNVYAQMGLKQQDVLAMSRVSTLASNVTTLKPQEATEAFTAATKTYGKAGENPMKYLDAWTEVEAKHAVTSQDLANGVKKVGTVARTVGVDFDQLNGLIAGIGSTTRQTGNEIGTSLKFVFSRLTTEKGPAALSKLGISVKDSVGDYRSGFDILGDMAGRWKDLTSAQKLHTAQALGGTRQYNTVMVAMDNWGEVLDATKASLNSTGSAERRNLEIMDTYVKKMEQVKAAAMEVKAAIGSAFLDIAKPALTGVKAVLGAFTNMPDVVAYPAAALGMGALGMAKGYGGMEMASITGVKWIGDAFSRGKENFGKGVYQTLGIDRKNKATDITGEIIEGVTDVAYIEELKKKQKVGKFEAAEVKRVRDMTSLKDTEGSLFGGVGYGVTWAGRGILRAGGKAAEKVGWKYGAEGLAKAGMTAEAAATQNAAAVAAGGVGTAVGGSSLAAFAAVAAVLVAIYATSKAIGAAWNYVNESADGYRDSMTKSLAETDEQLTNVRNLNSDFKRTSDIKSRSNFNALDQMDVNVRETEFANSMAAFNPEVAIGVDSLGNAILGVSDSLGVAKGSMEAFMSAAERSLIGEKLGKQFEIIKRYSEEIADVGAGETFKSGLKKALGWTGIVDPNITSAYKLKNATEAINSLTYQRTKAPIGERGAFNEKLREQWGIATKSKIDQATLVSTFNKYISGLDFGKNSAFKLEDVFGYINQPEFDSGFAALASNAKYKGTGTNADSIRAMKAMTIKYDELTPFLETTQPATEVRFRHAGIAPLENFNDVTKGSLVMFKESMKGIVNGMGVVESFDKDTKKATVSYLKKTADGITPESMTVTPGNVDLVAERIYESKAIVRGKENQRKELQERVTGADAGLKPLLTEKQFKEEIDMGVKYYSQIPKSTLMQTGYTYLPSAPEKYTRYPGEKEKEKGPYFGIPEANKNWADQFKGFREKYQEYTTTMERLGLIEGKGESAAVDAMPLMSSEESKAFSALRDEIKDLQVIFQFRDSIVELSQAMEEADRTTAGLIATEKKRGEVDLETGGFMSGVSKSIAGGVDVGITSVSAMSDQQKLLAASPLARGVALQIKEVDLKRNQELSRMDMAEKAKSGVGWLNNMYKGGKNITYDMKNVLTNTELTGGDVGSALQITGINALVDNTRTTNEILAAIEVNTTKEGEQTIGDLKKEGLDNIGKGIAGTGGIGTERHSLIELNKIKEDAIINKNPYKAQRAEEAIKAIQIAQIKAYGKSGAYQANLLFEDFNQAQFPFYGEEYNAHAYVNTLHEASGFSSDSENGTLPAFEGLVQSRQHGIGGGFRGTSLLSPSVLAYLYGSSSAEDTLKKASKVMADTYSPEEAIDYITSIKTDRGRSIPSLKAASLLADGPLNLHESKLSEEDINRFNRYTIGGTGVRRSNYTFKEGDTLKTAIREGYTEEEIDKYVLPGRIQKEYINNYKTNKPLRTGQAPPPIDWSALDSTFFPTPWGYDLPIQKEEKVGMAWNAMPEPPAYTENIKQAFANTQKYFDDVSNYSSQEATKFGTELGSLKDVLTLASKNFANLAMGAEAAAEALKSISGFSVDNVFGAGQKGYTGDVKPYKFEKDLNPNQRMYAYGIGRTSLEVQKQSETRLDYYSAEANKLIKQQAENKTFLASIQEGDIFTKKELEDAGIKGFSEEKSYGKSDIALKIAMDDKVLDTSIVKLKERFDAEAKVAEALAITNTLIATTVASFGRLKDSLQAVAGQRFVEDLPQYESFRSARSKMYGGDSPSAAQALTVDSVRQSYLLTGAVPENFSLNQFETEALDLKYKLAMGGLDTRGRMEATRQLRELPAKQQLAEEAYNEKRALDKMDRFVMAPYKSALDELGTLSTNAYIRPETKDKITNLGGLISDSMAAAYEKVPDGAGGYQFAGVSDETAQRITDAYKEVMFSISGTDGKTGQDIINENNLRPMVEPLSRINNDTSNMVQILSAILAASMDDEGPAKELLANKAEQTKKIESIAAEAETKIKNDPNITEDNKKRMLSEIDVFRKQGFGTSWAAGLSSDTMSAGGISGGINKAGIAMSLPGSAPLGIDKSAPQYKTTTKEITNADWDAEHQRMQDEINSQYEGFIPGSGELPGASRSRTRNLPSVMYESMGVYDAATNTIGGLPADSPEYAAKVADWKSRATASLGGTSMSPMMDYVATQGVGPLYNQRENSIKAKLDAYKKSNGILPDGSHMPIDYYNDEGRTTMNYEGLKESSGEYEYNSDGTFKGTKDIEGAVRPPLHKVYPGELDPNIGLSNVEHEAIKNSNQWIDYMNGRSYGRLPEGPFPIPGNQEEDAALDQYYKQKAKAAEESAIFNAKFEEDYQNGVDEYKLNSGGEVGVAYRLLTPKYNKNEYNASLSNADANQRKVGYPDLSPGRIRQSELDALNNVGTEDSLSSDAVLQNASASSQKVGYPDSNVDYKVFSPKYSKPESILTKAELPEKESFTNYAPSDVIPSKEAGVLASGGIAVSGPRTPPALISKIKTQLVENKPIVDSVNGMIDLTKMFNKYSPVGHGRNMGTEDLKTIGDRLYYGPETDSRGVTGAFGRPVSMAFKTTDSPLDLLGVIGHEVSHGLSEKVPFDPSMSVGENTEKELKSQNSFVSHAKLKGEAGRLAVLESFLIDKNKKYNFMDVKPISPEENSETVNERAAIKGTYGYAAENLFKRKSSKGAGFLNNFQYKVPQDTILDSIDKSKTDTNAEFLFDEQRAILQGLLAEGVVAGITTKEMVNSNILPQEQAEKYVTGINGVYGSLQSKDLPNITEGRPWMGSSIETNLAEFPGRATEAQKSIQDSSSLTGENLKEQPKEIKVVFEDSSMADIFKQGQKVKIEADTTDMENAFKQGYASTLKFDLDDLKSQVSEAVKGVDTEVKVKATVDRTAIDDALQSIGQSFSGLGPVVTVDYKANTTEVDKATADIISQSVTKDIEMVLLGADRVQEELNNIKAPNITSTVTVDRTAIDDALQSIGQSFSGLGPVVTPTVNDSALKKFVDDVINVQSSPLDIMANLIVNKADLDGITTDVNLRIKTTYEDKNAGSVGAMEKTLETISETFNDFLFRISDTESMVKGAVEMVNGIAEQNKVTSEEVGFIKETQLTQEARLYSVEVAKNDKTLLEELNGKINNLDSKYGPRIEEQSRTINKNKDLAGSKK